MFINANNVEADRNQRKPVFVMTSEEEEDVEMGGQEVIEEDLQYESEEEKKEVQPAQANSSNITQE